MSAFEFLSHFTCLGEKCPEHCCGSWAIEVDQDTKTRWDKLGQLTKNSYLSNVETIPEDPHQRSIFKKNSDSNCCNLNTQGLCQIQASHGHDYLPKICQEYPRRSIKYPCDILHSAYLSCPEISRLALDANTELLTPRITQALPQKNPLSSIDHVAAVLYDFVNKVLAEKKYYPSVQLHSIASALATAYGSIQGQASAIGDPLGNIKSSLKKPKEYLARSVAARKSHVSCESIKYFSVFMQTALGFLDQHPMRYPPCDYKNTRLYKALTSQEQTCNDELYIQQQFEKLSLVIAEHDYELLRRYIIVSFYNKGFPLLPTADNFLLGFLLSVVPHFIVNFLAACLLEQQGHFDRKQLVDVIYKVERKTSHSQALKEFLTAHRVPFDCLEHPDVFFYLY